MKKDYQKVSELKVLFKIGLISSTRIMDKLFSLATLIYSKPWYGWIFFSKLIELAMWFDVTESTSQDLNKGLPLPWNPKVESVETIIYYIISRVRTLVWAFWLTADIVEELVWVSLVEELSTFAWKIIVWWLWGQIKHSLMMWPYFLQ